MLRSMGRLPGPQGQGEHPRLEDHRSVKQVLGGEGGGGSEGEEEEEGEEGEEEG